MLKILTDEDIEKARLLTKDQTEECIELATIGVAPGDDDAYQGNLVWVTKTRANRNLVKAQAKETLIQLLDLIESEDFGWGWPYYGGCCGIATARGLRKVFEEEIEVESD